MAHKSTLIQQVLVAHIENGGINLENVKQISKEIAEKLKPQKKAHPLHKQFVEIYDAQGKEYGKTMIYGPREGKAIAEVIGKLSGLIMGKSGVLTDELLVDSWKHILAALPDFWKSSYDICAINNNLSSIINSIKSGRQKNGHINSGQVDDYLRVAREGSQQ